MTVFSRRPGRREPAYRGAKPMRIALAFALLLLAALAAPTARGQGATTKFRSAASLPATCSAGDDNSAADTIIVGGLYYACTATNTWTKYDPPSQPGSANPSSGNECSRGSIPFADVTCWGARPIYFSGTAPRTGASCNGTNKVAVESPAGFQVGDGITIYRCGATNKMGTPAAPAVTPSEAAGETGTGWVVNSPTGNSPYSYVIVARDKFGAVTAPGPATTIKTGQNKLGLQRDSIQSLTRSNDKVTVVTTAANKLVYDAVTEIESTLSHGFNGWFSIGHIDSPTQFELFATPVDSRAQGWQTKDVTSVGAGGTLAYYLGNHLKWDALPGAWEYYVCAERPGDTHFHLIGVTKPQGITSGYQDVQFDDWGSPYMDSQTYPPYVEILTGPNPDVPNSHDAICAGSATNDPLTTTITNITGNTITTASPAAQTIEKTMAIFDDGPTILNAMNSIAYHHSGPGGDSTLGGAVYIPPGKIYPNTTYPINSFLQVPAGLTIWQSGHLLLNETLAIAHSVNWFGDWGNIGAPQFGYNSGAPVDVKYASPGIDVYGAGNSFRSLNLNDLDANGGVLVVGENLNGSNFDRVNFVTGNNGGPTDYLSTAIILRDTSGTIDDVHFDKVLFYSGPDQVSDKSWTPLFWIAPGQDGKGGAQGIYFDITMDNSSWNRRGIALSDQGGGGTFIFNRFYRQGGITPVFSFQLQAFCTSCTNFIFNDEAQDTEGQPVIATLYTSPNVDNAIGYSVDFSTVGGSGGNSPLISGMRPAMFKLDPYPYMNNIGIPNRDAVVNGSGIQFTYAPYATASSAPTNGGLYSIMEAAHIPSGHSFFFDLMPPTRVTATPANGGSVPAGTWYYAVNSTGADGGESILSKPSAGAVTSSGTQAVNVAWTGANGAYSYNVYRCPKACTTSDGAPNPAATYWYRVCLHIVGLSCTDAAASPAQTSVPQVGGTGATIANKNGVYAPVAQAGIISTGGAAQVFGSAENSTTAACETNYGVTTLATKSTTTNTGLDCLPANAIIDAVVYRITTTITAAASFTIGDTGAPSRFCTTQSKLTAGSTGICIAQSGSSAAIQNAASAVRLTTNAAPGAGAIRLIVYYHTWTAPAN
jgi:hypothetical protein